MERVSSEKRDMEGDECWMWSLFSCCSGNGENASVYGGKRGGYVSFADESVGRGKFVSRSEGR